MAVTKEDVIDFISNMSVLELSEMIKEMEEKFGVSAAAPVAVAAAGPAVFNHNLETVPSLYQAVRPGSDYAWSLKLLSEYKARVPEVPTKSGLMLGLGETKDELQQVLHDLRRHEVDMVTMGQYLQPSRNHLPVTRYWHPDEFAELEDIARSLGFTHVASGPLVRSSYHADQQARGEVVR